VTHRPAVGTLGRGRDGRRHALAGGGLLTARLREDAAQVVRLSAGEHASRSRVKLSLLDLPLRRDQLLELIPAELRQEAELNARRLGPASGPA
jgi:hypothetical protein